MKCTRMSAQDSWRVYIRNVLRWNLDNVESHLWPRRREIDISYKGVMLAQKYRADIVCYEKIILELKAVKQLLPEHHAQLHNYLRATNMHLGLLVNFCNYPGVDIKRIAL